MTTKAANRLANSKGTALTEALLALTLTTAVLALFAVANAALERRKNAIERERNEAILRYKNP